MNVYEVLGAKIPIVYFIASNNESRFEFRVVNPENGEYINSDEALKILADALNTLVIDNVVVIEYVSIMPNNEVSVMILAITKKDDNTLFAERINKTYSIELQTVKLPRRPIPMPVAEKHEEKKVEAKPSEVEKKTEVRTAPEERKVEVKPAVEQKIEAKQSVEQKTEAKSVQEHKVEAKPAQEARK